MGDIKPIDRSDEPHSVWGVTCSACGHRWVAVAHYKLKPDDFQCRKCGGTHRKFIWQVDQGMPSEREDEIRAFVNHWVADEKREMPPTVEMAYDLLVELERVRGRFGCPDPACPGILAGEWPCDLVCGCCGFTVPAARRVSTTEVPHGT